MITLNEREQELCNIKLPTKTETYSPIPHFDFIERLQNKISENNYSIIDKKYMNNLAGTQLIGRYTLNYGEEDLNMNIGFKNSYDKSMAAGFALGATVIICSNGMVAGEYAIKRKHTGTAEEELNSFIDLSIAKSVESFTRLINTKNVMKNTIFNKSTINELIGKLTFEDEIIRAEQFSIIKNQYTSKEPIFNYNVDKDSAWNLYNLCTYAVDLKSTPALYINQHGRLLSTFEEVLGIQQPILELELIDDLN